MEGHPSFTRRGGFSLVEVVIGAAIFAMVATAVYQGYIAIYRASAAARIKVVAAALANEQFEIARNMPYASVGVQSSIPVGLIPRTQNFSRDGYQFIVTTTVRNVDDPFDSTLGGTPNDTAPADYKLFEVEINCSNCGDNFEPMKLTTRIAPKNLETASTNGALFIQVFDGNGQPVQGADVHVENNSTTTPIEIDDVTNDQGMLQLVDVPPGAMAYEISVTKDGYTQASTLSPALISNPLQPHASVLTQEVTQASFAIDKVSSIDLRTLSQSCAAIPSIDFNFRGSKLIATNPDVRKHSYSLSTNASGRYSSSTIEWDSYMIELSDLDYEIIGTNAVNPLVVTPDSSHQVNLILKDREPNTVLISVKDSGTGLPVANAEVELIKGAWSETKNTGRGFINQTDWSGGGGQGTSTNALMYYNSDGRIEDNLPAGEIRLKNIFGLFETLGELESSTFDTGTTSEFHELLWDPDDQPAASGPDSVKFQVATNNDTVTWNYTGPDGTNASYYTLANRNLGPEHDGNRYLRYKAFLSTADTSTTPNVSDVSFTFTSECTPPGQAAFWGLGTGLHTLQVRRAGYQDYERIIDITSPWQYFEVPLIP